MHCNKLITYLLTTQDGFATILQVLVEKGINPLHLNPAMPETDQNPDPKAEEQSIRWMQRVLFALGAVFVVVGVVRQWPLAGKTYMQFIEGDGYLSLMLGLIILVLGCSVRLLMGHEDEN